MAVEVRGRVRIEEAAKRVRAFRGGVPIADTIRPRLVWEIPYYPAYYIPAGDVRMDMLRPSTHTDRSPSRGDARFFSVVDGEKVAHNAAWQYPDSPIEAPSPRGSTNTGRGSGSAVLDCANHRTISA